MMQRHVHRISASLRDIDGWGTWTNNGANGGYKRIAAPKLELELNKRLMPGERIVGTHYEEGYWIIITENLGLGPAQTP